LTDIFKDFYQECKNANLIKMVFCSGKTILQIVLYGQDQFGGTADFKSAIYDCGDNITTR